MIINFESRKYLMTKNKLNIALIGYGKMGKIIEKVSIERGHKISLAISSSNQDQFNPENLEMVDVAIEFSTPKIAAQNLLVLAENEIPTVCGTTAWLDRYNEVSKAFQSHETGFLYASNFSIGVNIFFALNKKLAELMNAQSDYAIELEEIHHTQKLDAPSGTAISLATDIINKVDRKEKWMNEIVDDKTVLPIISQRIDKVPGTHRINYTSAIDSIEIKHTAFSRIGFASGALLAAEWIIGEKGIFTMNDVLAI